jgi:hypothetical protein
MNETLKQTSVVDRWFKHLSVQTKDYKTDWLGIIIMCPIEAKRLSADCCFSELHYKNATKCVGLVRV